MLRRSNPQSKARLPIRNAEVDASALLDSITTSVSSGFYRIQVLNRNSLVAEYFVVKGYPKRTYWCVLSSNNRLETHYLFKTLREAREFCVHQIMH